MSDLMISYASELVLCAVTCGVGLFFAFVSKNLQTNSTLRLALEELEGAVVAVCAQLQAQFVEKWKQAQDGKLTPQQVSQLRSLTQSITLQILTPALLGAIDAAGIDVQAKIIALQEKAVRDMK